MKEYPIIHKDPWALNAFESTIIEESEYISYSLMRVMGGWVFNYSTFIPFTDKKDSVNSSLF